MDIREMKKALAYAMAKSQDPPKIKQYAEEYFSSIGGDRRYKFKWRAICGNCNHSFSGLFDYCNRTYYFNKIGNELELEYYIH